MLNSFFNKLLTYFPAVSLFFHTSTGTVVTEDSPVYQDMTKKQLVEIAKTKGINLKMKMTKAVMIDILSNAE